MCERETETERVCAREKKKYRGIDKYNEREKERKEDRDNKRG